MSRLNVAIVGLIGVMKEGSLLLRSTTGKQKVGEEKIPKHFPRVVFRHGGVVKEVDLPDEAEVSFEFASSQVFGIADEALFLSFAGLLSKNGDSASVSHLCKNGDCEELAGRVVLSHGTLHPGESLVKDHVLCLDAAIANIKTEVTERFRPTKKKTEYDFPMPKVATGALLKVDLTSGGVRVKINGEPFDIEAGPVNGARRIEEEIPSTDFIVWVENVPKKSHHPGPPEKKPDLHFYLLYDFLLEDDVQRWVPVVYRSGPVIPPGSQCITPIMP